MIIYILIGFLSGIISGMGIGGGVILILSLKTICNLSQKEAQNINLLYFIPTSIIALIVHYKNKNIDFSISSKIIIFGIIGAFIGTFFAFKLEQDVLKKFFGIFLLITGIYEFLKKNKQ